jgi:chorismate dehydratase
VASVAIYTTRAIGDVRSIAMDTSSRTSVALARILCARAFNIQPEIQAHAPNLDTMLASADAALIIGDNALFVDADDAPDARRPESRRIEKIDLGRAWTDMTGLPFVYAFWAGRPGVLTPQGVAELQAAKQEGVLRVDDIVREYFTDTPARQALGARYLRDNIKYDFGDDERAGLELFYEYAAEAGLVSAPGRLRFY